MNIDQAIRKILIEIGDVLNKLSIGNRDIKFDPSILFIYAIILTTISSFTRSYYTITTLTISLIITILLLEINLKNILTPMATITFFAIVISLPAFILNAPTLIKIHNYSELIIFILRVVLSASIFTTIIGYLGWLGIIKALNRLLIPRSIVFSLTIFLRYIPLYIIDLSNIILARKARTFKGESIKILGSTAGDIILRSYERAWRFNKALRARLFNDTLNWNIEIGYSSMYKNLILISILIVTVALWLYVEGINCILKL